MKKIAFVFDIPKRPTKDIELIQRFLEPVVAFDTVYLTDDSCVKKLLVRDITLDMSTLDKYDFIVPVGAVVFQRLIKLKGGVTKYNGVPVEEPYKAVPITNPAIIYINPSEEPKVRKAFDTIFRLWETGFSVATSSEKKYEHVQSKERLLQLIAQWKSDSKMLAFDTETTSLDPFADVLIGASFSNEEHTGYFAEKAVLQECLPELSELLDGRIPILMHNSKFDKKWMRKEFDIDIPVFHDTLILHYLMVSQLRGSHSLKTLAMEYTDLRDYSNELDSYVSSYCRANKVKIDDFNYGMIDIDILAPYACGDVDATLQVMNNMGRKAYSKAQNITKKCYNEIMLPAVDMLLELELSGAPIDLEYLANLDNVLADDINTTRKSMLEDEAVIRFERMQAAPFNPNSFPQVGKLLFDVAGLPNNGYTDAGNYKTDKETLIGLAEKHNLPQQILDLRAASKMRGTYIQNIIGMVKGNGRVRGTFNLCLTESGRLSSSADTGDS